jgi:hypothetical protein
LLNSQRSSSKRPALTNVDPANGLRGKQKKRGTARFSASGPAGLPVGHAASTSVVSVAPVSSKGIIPLLIGSGFEAAHADLVDERYSQRK